MSHGFYQSSFYPNTSVWFQTTQWCVGFGDLTGLDNSKSDFYERLITQVE